MAYAGSAVGAVFAGDLLTLFVYWELLAVTSAVLVFARRTERAQASGMRYLIMQVGSGVLLLAGALVYASATGSLGFDYIGLDAPGGWLIFLAFGIKSCLPGAARLADRRLPGVDADRHGLSQRIHHQGRDLRARARFRRAPSC